jgi:hypothetical protein
MEDTAEHYKNVGDSIEFYTRRTAEEENEDPAGSSHLEDTQQGVLQYIEDKAYHPKNRQPSRDLYKWRAP